jgi:phage terminase large subunit-like protein
VAKRPPAGLSAWRAAVSDDLDRQGTEAFPYYFDEAAGSRACRFIELLPHIKGEWAKPTYSDGKLGYAKIKLEDWQVFLVINLFGWRHMLTQLRRFLRAYLEVARKNAKSTLAAAILLFMTTADGEPGAHTYSAATTGDQAREVFDVARNMALREAEFRPLRRRRRQARHHDRGDGEQRQAAQRRGLHARRAERPLRMRRRAARSQDARGVRRDRQRDRRALAAADPDDHDGRQRHVGHLLRAARLHGQGPRGHARRRDVVRHRLHDRRRGPLARPDGLAQGQPEPRRERQDRRPGRRRAQGARDAERAEQRAHEAAEQVGQCRHQLDAADEWKKCGDSKLQLADFAGEKCWIGMDLAEKRDFAALGARVPARRRFYLFVRLYLNELAVAESGNAHLQGWAHAGYVTVTDGNATDFDVIADDLRNYCQQFDVQEIPFDPALSRYFATKLVEEGLPLVEIRQAPMFFTQPLIQVENLVLERKLEHDDNPVMTWMISNVVVTKSKVTGLKHPTKAREENKIDGPVAGLLALGRAMLNGSNEHSQAFVDLNAPAVQTSAGSQA